MASVKCLFISGCRYKAISFIKKKHQTIGKKSHEKSFKKRIKPHLSSFMEFEPTFCVSVIYLNGLSTQNKKKVK